MKRNSQGVSVRLIVITFVLATFLTFLFGGVAAASGPTTSCVSASPIAQTVQLGQPAPVTVTIYCLPPSPSQFIYLTATWGDGTATQYTVCQEVCKVPPIVINTSHTYTRIGDFHPSFCLTPLPPTGTNQYCAYSTIQVV